MLVLLLVLAVACGTAAPQADPAQPPQVTDPANGSPAPTAVPGMTGEPAVTTPQGVLRLAYTSLGTDGIYPKSSNINAGGKDIQTTIYDWIIGSNAQGGFSTETGLAHDWSMTPDALQHTIHFRQGILFHDDTEVTAHDAKFSIEKVMEEDSLTTFIQELTPMLASLETPDDYTLEINCNEPCLFALWIFSAVRGVEGNVVNKVYYEEVGESRFAQSPVASGPYRFESQVLGSEITVEAMNRPHFRGGIPRYQTITFLAIPEETTRIANLRSGAVEVIDASRERVESLERGGFNIFYKERADLLGAYFFQQWEEDSPFRDRRVREAVNLSINRDAILTHIFGGQGGMAFYPFGSYGFESGVDAELATYPYDPARSVELLAEVGYNQGNPLRVDMGIYPFGGISEFPRMTEAMAADMEATGVIRVNMKPTEYGTLRELRRGHQLGGMIGPWATTNRASPAEIISINRALYYSHAPLTTYRHPEFDRIMEEAFAALDERVVADLINQMHRFLYEDHMGIPLFEVDTPFATVSDITSWDMGRDSYDKNLDYLVFPNRGN